MLTSAFDYNLPLELIAQTPAEPRDSSRLMVIDREKKILSHHKFFDLVNFLRPGDLLVWNNTKVFKARLYGELLLDENAVIFKEKVKPTDKILNAPRVEIFLVRPMENKFVWKVLAKPGRRLRLGMKVRFAPDFEGEVLLKENDGTFLMQFADEDMVVRAKANMYGEVPTPPYVKEQGTRNKEQASERYQTVYAQHEGSVAAPTAGFHFTPELIERIKLKGVEFAEVTLHVGLGTFLPVKTDKIEEHKMHSEWVEISAKNADLINQAKRERRRVVAVGTTTVRALEGVEGRLWSLDSSLSSDVQSPETKVQRPKSRDQSPLCPYNGDINIFITPGFKFQIVDALITNFHLPKSTLLMLVSAFTGDKNFILDCYKKAIEEGYWFYSFGDAMLIE